MSTIYDVARKAGVSRSTVSLVLNHSPLVNEKTRNHVEQVIREMNYVPNNNARGLSSQITRTLGVIIMQAEPLVSTEVSYHDDCHVGLCSMNICNGITTGLLHTGYGLITERFCSVDDPQALPQLILEKRVDGAFIVGNPYSRDFIANMKRTGIPFVVVGVGSYEETVDSVYADPFEGTYLAVRELLRRGHRDICLMNCPAEIRSHAWRTAGFQKALEEAGLPYRKGWDVPISMNNGKCAREALADFLDSGFRPDGIVTCNSPVAAGVQNCLYQRRIRIPEDISVIAYEDSSLCGYASPAITSVNVRKEELGKRASQLLLNRIADPRLDCVQEVIRPYLVNRDSVCDRTTEGKTFRNTDVN